MNATPLLHLALRSAELGSSRASSGWGRGRAGEGQVESGRQPQAPALPIGAVLARHPLAFSPCRLQLTTCSAHSSYRCRLKSNHGQRVIWERPWLHWQQLQAGRQAAPRLLLSLCLSLLPPLFLLSFVLEHECGTVNGFTGWRLAARCRAGHCLTAYFSSWAANFADRVFRAMSANCPANTPNIRP